MANGIAIKDVDNKLQSLGGEEVIPISTGANEPEVVEVDTLKEYINEDIDSALDTKQDVINDLATIRSGAALGATALQSYTESDPTVPSWAKQPSKPSYSYSEITGKPNLSAVATSGSYNDLTDKPDIPAAQIQSDWNQSNTSAKDFIKNKPTIPTVPTNVSAFTNDAGYLTEHQDISGKTNSEDLAAVAFSGDYEDLENTPTIPYVPEWAMSSTKPSYTVSEIDGAQEELVSGTNIKTINNESILGSGNITIQGGGGGDVNVIESITFNGSAVPVDASKNAAITYSAPVTSVNGNTGAVTLSIPEAQVQSDWDATTGMGVILNKPTIPSKISDLIDDSDFISTSSTSGLVKNDGSIDTNTYLTSSALSGYVQTSSTAGLIKNDGTIDTTSYGTYSKPSGGIPASDIASGVIPDVSGKENTSNKVTSLSSSSTDTQYPSAKAVYDLVGDIETLLSAI